MSQATDRIATAIARAFHRDIDEVRAELEQMVQEAGDMTEAQLITAWSERAASRVRFTVGPPSPLSDPD